MLETLTQSLIGPAILLAALGWVVPRILAIWFPEGVRPLIALAFCAALLMTLVAMGLFLSLYLSGGLTLSEFFALGVLDGLVHLAKISMASALIWAPVLVLSVAGLPKNWVEETW